MYRLTQINVYPIKSLGGFSVQEATVERRGLQYDRRWMLVDAQGQFMSQREIAAMTQLKTACTTNFLEVFDHKSPENRLQIDLQPPLEEMEKLRVKIWSETCSARLYPQAINDWFSDHLGMSLRLVYMPDTARRRADGRYAPKGHFVSFADGFPYLLVGEASLADLNERLAAPVPMNRFRPNLVFSGGQAYEEDQWSDFTIGNVAFRGVKPCGRCLVITTDQDTGTRYQEPLKTLATYRRTNNKVLFGQNVVLMENENSHKIIKVNDLMQKTNVSNA
jgi:uncharacterized protein YcbX